MDINSYYVKSLDPASDVMTEMTNWIVWKLTCGWNWGAGTRTLRGCLRRTAWPTECCCELRYAGCCTDFYLTNNQNVLRCWEETILHQVNNCIDIAKEWLQDKNDCFEECSWMHLKCSVWGKWWKLISGTFWETPINNECDRDQILVNGIEIGKILTCFYEEKWRKTWVVFWKNLRSEDKRVTRKMAEWHNGIINRIYHIKYSPHDRRDEKTSAWQFPMLVPTGQCNARWWLWSFSLCFNENFLWPETRFCMQILLSEIAGVRKCLAIPPLSS